MAPSARLQAACERRVRHASRPACAVAHRASATPALARRAPAAPSPAAMPAASLCAISPRRAPARGRQKASGCALDAARAMMVDRLLAAASASSRRPRPERSRQRLLRLLARSGRKASGRAAASRRRISTASWLAASASSRRPRSERRDAEVVQARWPGRAGRRRAAPPRAAGGCRPPPGSPPAPPPAAPGRRGMTPRLFRLMARSGRKASGRAAASCR